jgi:AcrR family transcriptional regulator
MTHVGVPPSEIETIADPRERLVAAAATVLHDELFAIISDGLRPEHITRTAGRSRRVFYDHFTDRNDVLREVALQYLEPNLGHLAERSADLGVAFDFVEGDLISGARLLVDATFEETLATRRSTMRIIGWCLGREDAVIGDAYRRHQQVADEIIGAMLDRLNATIGLRFRPPWTGPKMAATMRALAEGLYLRHELDHPDRPRVPASDSADGHERGPHVQGNGSPESGRAPADPVDVSELFTLTALCLLPTATQPAGTPDVPVAEHLDGFAKALTAAWREGGDLDQLLDARERVLQALRTTIAASGPGIDLDAVAATAGLSMRTVVAAFGSLAELADAAIDESLPALDREAAFDAAAGDIELEDMVRRHLLRLGQWAHSEPELARLWLASATGAVPAIDAKTAQRFSSRLAAPLTNMLRDAHPLRLGGPSRHTGSTATMATHVMLARMSAIEDFDLDESAQWLTDVVLRTLRLDQNPNA